MLKIGICDDSATDIKIIRSHVGKALFDFEDITIVEYVSGNQVVNAIKEEIFDCELLLLDIGMKPIDGIQVADFIRKNKVDVDIIFVTKTPEYVYEGYIYKAFSYVLKENMDRDMGKEMCRYVEELNSSEECLNVTFKGKPCRVAINSIWYVESNRRLIILHLRDGSEVSFYAKMTDIEEPLAERGFIRTHQSFMVRKQEIISMSREYVECEGFNVPLSRRYYQSVKDFFE